jgi:hypothetical protein
MQETSRNRLKKHSVTKNCSDLTPDQFFLTVGQNNFGNKIPFHFFFFEIRVKNTFDTFEINYVNFFLYLSKLILFDNHIIFHLHTYTHLLFFVCF